MRIAWGAAFVAAIICLLGGVIAAIRGEWFVAALLIFPFEGLRKNGAEPTPRFEGIS